MEFGRRYFWRGPGSGVACAGNTVTIEGDKVKMVASGAVNEIIGHGKERIPKPRPFKTERARHPPNQLLGVDILEWYDPAVGFLQEEKRERMGHPPFLAFLGMAASFGT
jgi:hypothetical protein